MRRQPSLSAGVQEHAAKERSCWLEVKEENGRLTGYFLNRTGSVLKLPEIAIDGITGGALDSNEGAPGPIMIQGDHSRIWVRKVLVIPIP